jgi:hypothetical protein
MFRSNLFIFGTVLLSIESAIYFIKSSLVLKAKIDEGVMKDIRRIVLLNDSLVALVFLSVFLNKHK